ncbi:hypothetical protein JJB07_17790 [Tumebacillus sp. ITR2]|uniref:Peptidase S53 domain-containing protein n=1 Tax=Tumebacillus amylolyticus TaxID=2801339 RepID=A0ABS1JDT5_9BACL|nr:protease pro-enzyme activation domain-containing protein [Tumebacillus amylolyticus]MBL0388457.1 hypothetical protein [Tumebacillus amylolyticus]
MAKRFQKALIPTALAVLSLAFAPVQGAMAQAPVKVKMNGQEANSAKHGTLLGHKAGNEKVSITLSLKLQHADQIDGFIADLYDPASPNYKKFLTSDQWASKFGPAQSDVDSVVSYVKSNGLTVSDMSKDQQFITVEGKASQIESAFGVTLNNYKNAKGETYFANSDAPVVPSAIANALLGVHGLSSEAVAHRNATQKPTTSNAPYVAGKPNLLQPNVGSGPTGGYTPTELRNAYDISPVISAGYNGTGQTVALFELDGYVQSNITTYVNNYGLGSPTPSKVLVDGYNGAAGSGQGEVELDIEVVNAIAPKANTIVYEGPNTDAGVLDTYKKIANDNTAQVVSISWGLCEPNNTASSMSSLHTVFQQMATQGQSVFAAAGDDGAYDCGDTKLSVDNPADDTYVTGVGGTYMTLSGTSYGSEKVWGNSSNKSGGGGGLSTVYAQPSWQTGPGVSNSYSNGKRQVPDVSAVADPATGYSIYSAGSWVVYGGTSCAAPLWAGIAALNNNYAASNGKSKLGQANPTLYKMFNTTQTYNAYHDVTTGTNLYYPATSGYDLATGIGTPDAWNLIRDINSGTTPPPPPPGGELIVNGGFESGSTNWTESSSGGYELVDTSKPHAGTKGLYLCGYNNCTDSAYQTVTIPSTATSATLSLWTYVSTTETSHSYDYLKVQLRNSSNTVLSTLQTQSDATATGWVKQTFDVSSYKGQTVRVYLLGTNDSSNTTSFYVDDVSLQYN